MCQMNSGTREGSRWLGVSFMSFIIAHSPSMRQPMPGKEDLQGEKEPDFENELAPKADSVFCLLGHG